MEKNACGHHHKHHEGKEPGNLSMKVYKHDQATVASACFVSREEVHSLQKKISEILKDMAGWVSENNGIIGHLKSSLQTQGETIILSLTEDSVNANKSGSKEVTINLACIVFGIDEKDMEKKLADVLDPVIHRR
ncbi:MAG: hypothetical protein HGA49_05480 [Eubacteriaceae bacterium]|nr:hypothetical protein [Eubacteriaceae bacterium]